MLGIVERETTQAPKQRKLRGRAPTPMGQPRPYRAPLATFLVLVASARATRQVEDEAPEAIEDDARRAS